MADLKTVGQSVIRRDVWAKVTGEAVYGDDASLPHMLHMKLVFAGIPHGRIRQLHTTAAENYPGVVAVFTAADVPVNVMGLVTKDQQVFCEEKVRFEGDQVCAVVAETAVQAAAAAKLIQIEYDELPILDSPETALAENATLVHEDKPGNICHQIRLRRGDADAALAQADIVIEREYFTPWQEHAYLEPEAGLAYIDENGRVTVRVSGQSTHDDLRQITEALDLPEDQVRVIYGTIGGAFGGREDVTIQIALALAAWKLQRPVKLVWNREESIKGHGKRHPITIRHKWGAQRDGTLLGAKIEVISDAGAYNHTSSEVLINFYYAAIGAYQVPHVSLDGYAVFTNNIPGCAFRGFGSPQATFAAELQVEHIAEALHLDPVTIRLKNCVREGSIISTQSELPAGVSLPALIEACATKLGAKPKGDSWHMPVVQSDQPHKRRGIGIAIGMKNSGFGWGFPEGSEARVVLHGRSQIEQVELYTAAADCGQGSHTALAQVAAEVLGVPLEYIETITSDTATAGNAGPASASRLTIFAGQAVKQAAEQALENWQNEERPAVGSGRWDAPLTTSPDPKTGACFNSITYAYGAQAVEVEVDMETGEIEVLNIVAAHDPGRAVNPQQVRGQLQGSIVQAQGWAMTEDFKVQGGHIQTEQLSTYLIPTSVDAASNINIVLLEQPDTIGPYGVRGVGEIGILMLAPALASAVHDATGVWFDRIPLNPERVVAGLQAMT
ncbi:MAG: aldehyde oxidase [Chloroflexi bacterium]|nr:MAG: aldehyde oxidase [Chloroflexota bacterium]